MTGRVRGRARAGWGAALLLVAGCAAAPVAPPRAQVAPVAQVASPADLYGPLFEAVQMRRVFADGKTFADAVPRRDPEAIMAEWRAGDFSGDAALRAFVRRNFTVPEDRAAPPASDARPPLAQHIRALWPQLTRAPEVPPAGSSALAQPRRYVVPGGRFREMYYWDTYFTMLGLRADGRGELIDDMVADFVSLVERYGHVPNGTRTYYLSRSQPPFLYLMMDLATPGDRATEARRLAALRREHRFWIAERSVAMPDGVRLQRWGDAKRTPRDESWREDVEAARGRANPAQAYNDLRAGAESGWDYSSRWLADGRTLATIDTTRVVPVDLNSLLYGLERAIARRCRATGDPCGMEFDAMAETRRAAIERWLWDAEGARYGDYDLEAKRLRGGLTAATAYPLFTGVAAPARGRAAAATIARDLIAPHGLRTTLVDTGQQWDRPNGWAPLQWIAAEGLRAYGRDDAARVIATRFLATVEREYRASGRLLEKYDVEESRAGGGGEYPTQDGFGWTNGVVRGFQERYGG